MSQPAALCRNKVQVELKEEIELCCDKEFFCCDTLDSCHDIDQGKWQWNFVTIILTLSQHKRMNIANELYHDKRQLCFNRVWQGYSTI